ncbi:RNA polymerase sigma factor [Sphingobacterium sp. DR205]|uniref:RNA polymerase sigma factor n=1 Tax=Sphingobacterium sp. DR205 TaxID=2713573 RepID=UPI0013E4ABA5|nr:RNA polymerase sigma factor [Sphingobacterium sp. DR205]QIH31464.1 RNA polymerase sigma factor [Sphingobacterium sp. DR205]
MKKSRYRSYSDNELVEQMFQGDRNSFAELYDRYFAVIYSFVRKMLRDSDQAEDVTQEIFLAFYENGTQTPVKSVRSYLYQSARYAIVDLFRKQKHQNNYLAGLQDYYHKGAWTTDDMLIERELQHRIEQEVDGLPPKMRKIFELSRRQYLSNKEIADQLSLSEGTVRQQIHNAIVRLRSRLTCYIWLQVMVLLWWIGKML